MDPDIDDFFLQPYQVNLIALPTFQQIAQIDSTQNFQHQQREESPQNSIVMQPSPINCPIFQNQSPAISQFDEEDFSLLNHMQEPSQLNLLDISQLSQLQPKTKQDLTDQPRYKKKKVGCACTKRKCSSKYCFCIKDGQTCSNLCKCVDCNNKSSTSLHARSLMSEKKGCKCKKNFCLKGYCDCFAKGQQCNDYCKCVDCKNIIIVANLKDKTQVPIIKKKIKKFSKFYRNKKGYLRTNKTKVLTSIERKKS